MDWHLTRLDSVGRGAGARFRVKVPGNRFSWADVTFVEVERPHRIVEAGRAGKNNRVRTLGVYELAPAALGSTRLRFTVQNHWDPLIPESAMPPVMKKGVVVIEFIIDKTGHVSGMKLVSSSGDVALDRAAWGAITDAIPLPNLPVQFAGQNLQIRARFYYNPDKADME